MANYDFDINILAGRNSGINEMYAVIKQMSANFIDNVQAYLRKVLEVGYSVAQPIFGNSVVVSTEVLGLKGVLKADGEAVCFIEFGTGAPTNRDGNPLANNLKIQVVPGSWSKDHAKTWEKWIQSGKDPEEYPYNSYPKSAMYKAYQAMVTAISDIAKEGIL